MTAIWNDIEITFRDQTHTIRPTLSLINLIESKTGKSITSFIIQVSAQDIPVAWSAQVVAATLNYAGVQVTGDDVYSEFGISPELPSIAANIILACLPPQKTTNLESENAKKGGKSKAGK